MSILKQVKCPPTTKKKTMKTAAKVWIPSLNRYALQYSGVDDLFGFKRNKKLAEKTTLGTNYFKSVEGQICDTKSEPACVGAQKHIYIKGYPLGKTVELEEGKLKKTSMLGKTGLIGSISEDLSNFHMQEHVRALFNKGIYGNKTCMKAKLPVGSFLLKSSKFRKSKPKTKKEQDDTWWIEEKCVPREKTHPVTYGEQKFEFPFHTKESFKVSDKIQKLRYCDWYVLLFLLLGSIFCILVLKTLE